MDDPYLPDITLQEYFNLRDGYYRRLLNLNTQIRQRRKQKLSIRELNEQRKNVNRYYNLLDLHKNSFDNPKSKSIYLELLKEYKNG